MTTLVTGKNQVTIPVVVAQKLRIQRGSRVEWMVDEKRRQAVLKVQPSRGELGLAIMKIGRKCGEPGEEWVKELIKERVRDDDEMTKSERK